VTKEKNDMLLFHGAMIGMFVHLVLVIQAYLGAANLSYLGISDQHVSDTIWREYAGVILTMLGSITLSHLVLGALMGVLAARILFLTRAGLLLTRTRFGKALALIVTVLILHFLFLAASMSHYPQLYVESFHNKLGIRAFIQKAICFSPLPFSSMTLLAAVLSLWTLLETRRAIQFRFSAPGVKGLVFSTLLLCGFIIVVYQQQDGSAPSSGAYATPIHGERGADAPPNLLIIAADSLRADRIFSEAGPVYAVAPNMARLAREGTSFTRAYTVLPRTFPSWVSMLTGRYPSNHHIQHMFPTTADRSGLPPAVPLLLAQKGYTTAVVTDFAGDIFSRVDLGFQHVQAPYFNFPTLVGQRILELDYHLLPYVANGTGRHLFPVVEGFAQNADPALLTDKVLVTLPKLPEPWMLIVFYSSTHFPYAAPTPYYKMFTDPNYEGPFKYHKPPDLVEKSYTEADILQIRNTYDGAVRAVDDQVGRLVNSLEKQTGLLNRTVMVITADHGENLYDGDLGMGHGDHLFGEPSVRIPLIFWSRNGMVPPGRICRSVVPSIDLAPTLLDFAGLKKDSLPVMDGASLKTYMSTGSASLEGNQLHAHNSDMNSGADRPVLMETGIWFSKEAGDIRQQKRITYPPLTELAEIDRGTNHEVVLKNIYAPMVRFAKHRALYQEGRKLMYIPTAEGVHWLMFDPVADPMNEHDLLHKEPEIAKRLKENLLALLTEENHNLIESGYVVPRRAMVWTPAPLPRPGWLSFLDSRDIMLP